MPGVKEKKKKRPPPRRARRLARAGSRGYVGHPAGAGRAASRRRTRSHAVRSRDLPDIPAAASPARRFPIKQPHIRLKIFAKSALGPKINHSPQPDRVQTNV